MLREIRCEKFRTGVVRFHPGLNVVLGDDNASLDSTVTTLAVAAVADSAQSVILQQVSHGIAIRMAVMAMALGTLSGSAPNTHENTDI